MSTLPRTFPGLTRSLNSSKSTGRRRTPRGISANASRSNLSLSTSYAVSPVIASVAEGRGTAARGQIGVAAVDMQTMDFFLFYFVDSSAYSTLKAQLQILDPVEVIVCDSLNERNTNVVLHEAARSAGESVTLSAVHRRYFDGAKGFELFKSLRAVECSSELDNPEGKELCLAAFAALVKYVEHIDGIIFAHSSLRIVLQSNEGLCLMDAETWKNLRVIEEGRGKKDKRSLFTLLNHTLTSMGARLLRQNLMQPLSSEEILNDRLDALQELLSRSHFVDKMRGLLSRAYSVDSVLSVVVQNHIEKTTATAEYRIVQLQHLQQTLQLVEPLRLLLSTVQAPIIANKANTLADGRLDEVATILDDTLDDEVLRMTTGKKNSMSTRNQKCFAVREGLSPPLDVARKAYEELLVDLQNERGELEEFLPDQPVRLAYSAARLFHYVWMTTNANTVRVPSHFINIVRNKASLTFSSRTLMRYNDRVEQSVCEVMLASDDVIYHALERIRPLVASLYTLVDTLSLLDFLTSLAVYASQRDTVRPSFGNAIVIKKGKYPLLDLTETTVFANDAYLTPDSPFALITGPNMAGKSTYTRQIGSLCLLAQIGSFVPAEAASLPLFTRISSRVGHNDTFAENLSSFAMEMREMEAILSSADERTLVLIDELARSTSVEEGIGISYAIIEELIQLKCFVVFTSHFLDLATLDAVYSSVENFHFAPQVRMTAEGEALDPSHALYRGAYSGPLYGFEVAELSALPPTMLDRARSLAEKLRQDSNASRRDAQGEKRRILLRAAHAFRSLLRLQSGESTRKALIQIRAQMMSDLEELHE